MRVLEKLNLIENIAIELQARFTYDLINNFLAEFNVNPAFQPDYNSKRLYVRNRLQGIKTSEIKKIADELSIDTQNLIEEPPKNWESTQSAKAFISHTATNKSYAKRLRDSLKPYNIDCFVAHEDIKPSKEWQEEIRRALNTMDFFISIHKKGFSARLWCQQEVGFAFAKNVKIIPVKFDEDPEGFIGKYQALIRGQKTDEEVATEILDILKEDELTKELYNNKIGHYRANQEIPF